MPAFDTTLASASVSDACPEHGDEPGEPLAEPPPGNASTRWKILCKGPRRMVLFAGAPTDETTKGARRLGIEIGIAISGRQVGSLARFDSFDYAFIDYRRDVDAAFSDALRDLARSNWLIDHQASWSVIVTQNPTTHAHSSSKVFKGVKIDAR